MKGFFVEGTSKSSRPRSSTTKQIHSEKTFIEAPVDQEQGEEKNISASLKPAISGYKTVAWHTTEKKNAVERKRISDPVKVSGETERKNRVPKAAFRVTLFAILFFCVAMYSFFNLQLAFYFVLGILFITFVFALVGFFTSLNSGKDKVSTTRGGRALGIISLLLSLAVFAAIAWFFVNTPIDL
jgi:heme/copper-type cytochrome/quinol oxidase subunit 4